MNLIQLIRRSLTLEMKPKSEGDGVHQGLYWIQSLGFRYTQLLAPEVSRVSRRLILEGENLQVL